MKRPSIADIINQTSQLSGVAVPDIIGECRQIPLPMMRWAVASVAREYGYSFRQIGKALGGRDHSTMQHGLKQVVYRISRGHEVGKFVASLSERVRNMDPATSTMAFEFITVIAPKMRKCKPKNDFRPASDRDDGHAFHASIASGSRRLANAIFDARAA